MQILDKPKRIVFRLQIDGLAKDCSNSIANALELLQFFAKPSKCPVGNNPLMALYLLLIVRRINDGGNLLPNTAKGIFP